MTGVRWERVLPGGMAVLLLTQLALGGLAAIAPGLTAGRGTALAAAWALVGVLLCAALVARSVPVATARRHGALVGLAAALIGLTFYGWWGLPAAAFCALSVAAGLLGAALVGQVRQGAH